MSGYVYVIAFDNGVVKVGRSQDVAHRVNQHEAMGRSFGLAVTADWRSPQHDGWIENEQELKRLAHELGGVPNTDEYFTGVCFNALAAKAAELKFPPPRPEVPPPSQDPRKRARPRSLRKMPNWLPDEFAHFTYELIPRQGCAVEDAIEHLADRVLTDPETMRLLAAQYVGKQLRWMLKRSLGGVTESGLVVPEPPEPPDPQPPQPPVASGPRDRGGHLRLIVADVLTDLAAKAA